MRIAVSRHGIPFLSASLIFLVLAAILSATWTSWARYLLLLSALFLVLLFLTFFRDPERSPPSGSGLILAPAVGRILRFTEASEESYPA